MTVEELQAQFVSHREQFIDHKARIETDLDNIKKEQEETRVGMNEALKGLRSQIGALHQRIPNNGWRSKAAIGGGTGGALVILHFLAKVFGVEI